MIALYIVCACILFLSLLVLISEWRLLFLRKKRRKRTAVFAARDYAHRGLHGNGIPENSLAAFRLAAENNYAIELDVQLTRDGIPVVFHDGTLTRVCGVPGGIADYTYAELLTFRLLGSEETIPAFSDVLSLIDGRVPLLIELKNDGDGKKTTLAAAKLLKEYRGLYCVESFNPLLLRTFRREIPGAVCGVLSCNFSRQQAPRNLLYFLLRHLFFDFLATPDFIAYDFHDGHAFALRAARLFGAATFAWTIRNEEERKMAAGFGFDSLIFENIRPKRENL